jgi:UMF1 family MFS transporter
MASIYGTEMGLDMKFLIGALLLVQFVGIPFSFLFGYIATRIGAKRAIFITLAVYLVISVFGYFMDTKLEFFIMAGLVGTVQGGSQALSRSLFTTMVPKHKSSEFFAFFSVFEKFAGILGPLVFALMIRATGSSRGAILSLIAFFLVGGALLAMVDVDKGQRAARAAEGRALQGA